MAKIESSKSFETASMYSENELPRKNLAKEAIMRRHYCFIAILLIFMPVNVFSQATYDAESKLLSVKSEGRPLKELLSEVSAKTGIEVYISPAVDKKVFAEIESQPVEDAIKRMIKPLNNAFVYLGESIEAVKIFEKSEAEATLKITPGVVMPRVTRSKLTSPSFGQGLDKRMLTREELEAKARERRQTAESQGRIDEPEKEKTKGERGSGKGKRKNIGKKKREEERERMREEEQQKQNQLESEENPQNKVGD
jgi:hypothetical protein